LSDLGHTSSSLRPTLATYGNPVLTDETLKKVDLESIEAGDVPGIGIHTANALYGLKSIWIRSRFIKSLRARLAFVLISKMYRQMNADTGIATDTRLA
jgi:hypothetical protein